MRPVSCWALRSTLSAAVVGFALILVLSTFYGLRAQTYDIDEVTRMPARSMVYASDGVTEIGTIHGDNRLMVKYDEVSKWFISALIAREDARFYNHGAVDMRGVARAALRFFTRGKKEGASTISMQLADNSFTYRGKTVDGKLLEMALAFRIENKFSKEEILEHYMNRIFWGHSIRGIESASRTYFEKSAKELSLSESAMLAGIIRGPNTFSPFVNLDAAREQRDVTLERMVFYGFINADQATEAKQERLAIRPSGRRIIHDSYAMDAIRRDLDIILEKHNIKMGGLHIKTTLDPALQKAAEKAVEEHLSKIEKSSGYSHQTRKQFLANPRARRAPQYIQGALVCLENKTGAVKALVGGRNADESKFNRALQARRQIGSVFKPFVYMAAFDKGLQPGGWVRDSRIRPGEIIGAQRTWSPQNSDGTYKELMTVSDALARSRNTASVRIGNYAGIDNVVETARKLGFDSNKISRSPATYLGAFEASPWQVAQAYTIFPNGGIINRPYIISEITDSEGNVVYPGDGVIPYQAVLKKGSACSVAKTLQRVTDGGTGSSLRSTYGYKAPCGGKTGTTDNYRDAWFAGFNSSLTCAVWVGMDNNRRTMYRGYGATLALPIWAKVMKKAEDLNYPSTEIIQDHAFKIVRICRNSSQIATAGCEHHRTAYNASIPIDLIPRHSCDNHPVRAQIIEEAPPRGIPTR